MNIPGTNLLNLALSVMNKAQLQYSAYTGRNLDGIGVYDTSYASPVTVFGSFQVVPRNLFQRMGLDFNSSYANIFAPQNITDVTRLSAGDQFTYRSQVWQVLSTTPWFGVDGWSEALCILVPSPNNNYLTETGFTYVTEDGSQSYTTEQ